MAISPAQIDHFNQTIQDLGADRKVSQNLQARFDAAVAVNDASLARDIYKEAVRTFASSAKTRVSSAESLQKSEGSKKLAATMIRLASRHNESLDDRPDSVSKLEGSLRKYKATELV